MSGSWAPLFSRHPFGTPGVFIYIYICPSTHRMIHRFQLLRFSDSNTLYKLTSASASSSMNMIIHDHASIRSRHDEHPALLVLAKPICTIESFPPPQHAPRQPARCGGRRAKRDGPGLLFRPQDTRIIAQDYPQVHHGSSQQHLPVEKNTLRPFLTK